MGLLFSGTLTNLWASRYPTIALNTQYLLTGLVHEQSCPLHKIMQEAKNSFLIPTTLETPLSGSLGVKNQEP